jgi:cyclophilin family peptidyl-prolyl cis-trans isomerase
MILVLNYLSQESPMRGSHMTIASAVLIAIGLAGLLYATGAGDNPTTRPAGTTQPATGPATQPTSQPAKPQVVIDTTMGEIVVELEEQRTPATVKNFLRYVDDRFYDGLIFHRVIEGFMIQAGGVTTGDQPREPKYPPVINESRKGASNTRGTIAMARMTNPNSATSQFFINHGNNARLDTYGGGYTVFGRVVKGMDVVDKIAAVPVQQTAVSEAQPLEDVVIRSIRRK